MNRVKPIVRTIGNFGVSFFSPLVGGNVAETMFDTGLSLNQILMIALFSAIFVTGLSISKEAVEWAKRSEWEEDGTEGD